MQTKMFAIILQIKIFIICLQHKIKTKYIMKIKGIKSVVSEFNKMYLNNFGRIFFDSQKNEVYMFEYVDCNSGPCCLPDSVFQIAHLARRSGKITMKYVQNCIDECKYERNID